MTLSEFAIKHGVRPETTNQGATWLYMADSTEEARSEAYGLSDYRVSSSCGASMYLTKK